MAGQEATDVQPDLQQARRVANGPSVTEWLVAVRVAVGDLGDLGTRHDEGRSPGRFGHPEVLPQIPFHLPPMSPSSRTARPSSWTIGERLVSRSRRTRGQAKNDEPTDARRER